MKTILLFKPCEKSFIRQEEAFLKKKYIIKSFTSPDHSFFQNLNTLVRQILFLVSNIKSADYIYVCYADYHAFFPLLLGRVFKKESVLIIGGYEAAKLAEFNYGAHLSTPRSWVVKKCCDLASIILPVSSFVLKNLVQNIRTAHPLKTKIVYKGADTSDYCFDYTIDKHGIVCISEASTMQRLKVKGLDFFARLASIFPYKKFTIIGVTGEARRYLENLEIPNLVLVSNANNREVKGLLNESEIICQFSRYESFGQALAEGMLCGCIPISVQGIGPEEIISKDVGIIIEDLDIKKGKEAIEKALSMQWDIRNRARFKIINNFSLKLREDNIFAILNVLGS